MRKEHLQLEKKRKKEIETDWNFNQVICFLLKKKVDRKK